MSPCPIHADHADSGNAHMVSLRYFFQRFAVKQAAQNLMHFYFGELVHAMRRTFLPMSTKYAASMKRVLASGHIFQIVQTVVDLIAILVVPLIPERTWTNEGGENQQMHLMFFRSPIAAELDSAIAARDIRTQHLAMVAHLPAIRNHVKTFISGNVAPALYFNYHVGSIAHG